MADNTNLSSKTRLKTHKIYSNAMCLLKEKRVNKVFVGHEKGLQIYDCYEQQVVDVNLG